MPPITIPAKDNFDKSKKYPAIFSFRTSFFFLTSSVNVNSCNMEINQNRNRILKSSYRLYSSIYTAYYTKQDYSCQTYRK